MPEHTTHTLFQSDLLTVEDYRCAGLDHGRGEEEASPQAAIVFPRRGVYVRYDALGRAVADPNQVLFFNPNQPYSVSHPVEGGDDSTAYYPAKSVLEEMLQETDAASLERRAPFKHNAVPAVPGLRYHQALLLRAAAQGLGDPLEIEERLLLLLGETLAGPTLSPPPGRASQVHADLVHETKLALSARFRQRLKLDQIAGMVHSSPYHLCRVFLQHTGQTIHHYLQSLRLAHALDALAEQPHTGLTTIAFGLGFSSHSHFTSVFRKHYGDTPTNYRRKLHKRARI